MDLVQLKDGSLEAIGTHRDLVDIVESGCGYEVAKMVESLDPANIEGVYNGYDSLFKTVWEFLKPLKEAGEGLTVEQTEKLYNALDKSMDMIGECL